MVNPYDAKVKSLSYEIRTSDGSKVLENRKIKSLKSSENYLRTDIEITSPLLMNQEYSLQILLDTDEGDIYYYTRLVSRSSTNTSQYVEFWQLIWSRQSPLSGIMQISVFSRLWQILVGEI